jgi:hypothetical protein
VDVAAVAWAAGLFEGEGSVTVCRERRRLQLKMISEESVRRFHVIVGAGKVYGPYSNRSGDSYPRSPFFLWVAEGADAEAVVAMLFPLLSEWRRVAMYELFADVVGDAPAHLRVQVRAVPD